MMPPMSPGAGGNSQAAERPDSAGLLNAGPKPWEGEVPPLGDPQTPVGGTQQGLGGMPMMPPMSPGAGGNSQAAERPDSAGLLNAGPKPWESEAPDLGEPEAPQGALPGVTAPDTPTPTAEVPAAPAGQDLQRPVIVPPVPGSPGWSPTASTPGDGTRPAVGGTPEVPPGVGNHKDQAAERSDASGLRESTGTPWEHDGPDLGEPDVSQGAETRETADWAAIGPALGKPVPVPEPEAEHSEEPEDWVPVVRRVGGEQDTSAWDVPGDGLPWLVLFPVTGRTDEERDRPAPHYTLRDTRPWEPPGDSGYASWRRAKWAEGDTVIDEEEKKPLRCGGPNFTPEELAEMEAEEERARAEAEQAEEEQEEEQEQERSSSDLLVRDTSAWGDESAGPPSGVIG
jgi:hypothetical protein